MSEVSIPDLIGFIDQTLYANRDSSPDVKWRNSEVLRLLEDVRRLATSQPVQVEVTDEMVKAAMKASEFEGFTVSVWRMRAALEAALTPILAVPVPEVIPGTRAALDGLSIRTGGGE